MSVVRKGSGKGSDPMPALMALPGFDSDVIKKLRKRKINSVAGAHRDEACTGSFAVIGVGRWLSGDQHSSAHLLWVERSSCPLGWSATLTMAATLSLQSSRSGSLLQLISNSEASQIF